MAKKSKKREEGLDLSEAGELWSEEELRQMIREEYLKLLMERQGQAVQPNTTQPQIYPTVYPNYPTVHPGGWQSSGNINHYNDGHQSICNNAVMAMA